MHLLRANLQASPDHPDFAPGELVAAICMVDIAVADADGARSRAADWLAELSWSRVEFGTVVLLPEAPDLAGFTPELREAYADARRLGVSIVLYPEASRAA